MAKSHKQVPGLQANVEGLQAELAAHPELFDLFDFRKGQKDSPHREMKDIWVRYNNLQPYMAKGSLEGFNDEHDSIWYPAAEKLPSAKRIAFELMAAVQGERLGGVLITRLPPGGKITPHTDAGWHARYYQKYYVPVKNAPGSVFAFEDGIIAPREGEVYWFDNSYLHWVDNDTDEERLSMIVCIKTDTPYGRH